MIKLHFGALHSNKIQTLFKSEPFWESEQPVHEKKRGKKVGLNLPTDYSFGLSWFPRNCGGK
jgi:hypothetical protein